MKSNSKLVLFVAILVAITTLCKFFFGPSLVMSGITPMFAIALFAGMVFKKKEWLFLFPIVSLFVSDLIIQGLYLSNQFDYPGIYGGQWKNYVILLISALLGWTLQAKSYKSLLAASVASPTVFFLASNFFVWTNSTEAVYSKSLVGLINCYEAGLPFYRNSLIATLVFLPLVLVTFNWINEGKKVAKLA
jgi:hypothetical protein